MKQILDILKEVFGRVEALILLMIIHGDMYILLEIQLYLTMVSNSLDQVEEVIVDMYQQYLLILMKILHGQMVEM